MRTVFVNGTRIVGRLGSVDLNPCAYRNGSPVHSRKRRVVHVLRNVSGSRRIRSFELSCYGTASDVRQRIPVLLVQVIHRVVTDEVHIAIERSVG